jgi:hypothetical protein
MKYIFNNKEYEFELPTYICINSCAGSGKTTIILQFILDNILNNTYKLSNFFITTFTYNSAKQLKEKIQNKINIKGNNYIGTFHSLASRIITKVNKKLLNNIHIDETQYILNKLLIDDKLIEIFSDIKFLIIDEFQDLNEIQFKIIQNIINKFNHISLICVGDISQNIYSFRGSSIEYISNFTKYFNKGITIQMNDNYRSTQSIINIANIIGNKNMRCNNITNTNIPKLLVFDSISNEINYIINEIKKDIFQNHIDPNDICIITRNNQLLFFFEGKLFEKNIKNILISDEKIRGNIPNNHIILSTIHGSKGLEYKKVYLVGMTDTFFPHNKDENSIEEEKRLCYVAVTRSKEELIVSYTKTSQHMLSRFFSTIPKELFIIKDFSRQTTLIEKNFIRDNITVTNLIKLLDGNDYNIMRNNDILKNYEINEKKIYEEYTYPEFVNSENYYCEFGIFIDYLIRRMIGQNIKNIYDYRAKEIITSVYLDINQYQIYNKYLPFINTVINEITGKNKVIPYMKERINEYINKYVKNKKITTKLIIQEILLNIIRNGKTFNIEYNKIKITNKEYLPNILQNIIKINYLNFIDNSKDWKEIINDIWQISKLHFVYIDRKRALYIDIPIDEIIKMKSFYENIYEYISNKYKSYNIILNPNLSNNRIGAEGDILIEKDNEYTIIDIKVSNSNIFNIEYLIQLMVYTELLREQNKIVNNAIIFNPLLGIEYNIDLVKWNKGNELINYLISKYK